MSHNSPDWTYSYVPAASEWNSWWTQKLDWAPGFDQILNTTAGQLVANIDGAFGGLSLSGDFTLDGNELELTPVVSAGTFNIGSVSATGRIVSYSSVSYLFGSVIAGGTFGGTASIVTGLAVMNDGRTTAVSTRPSGGQITLNATASSTLTVTPTLGIENFWVKGPASGGTVNVVIAPGQQVGQKIVVNFSQGATAANFIFGTTGAGMNFGTGLRPPTITATAGNRDNTVWILNDGTALWDFEAITQGFSP